MASPSMEETASKESGATISQQMKRVGSHVLEAVTSQSSAAEPSAKRSRNGDEANEAVHTATDEEVAARMAAEAEQLAVAAKNAKVPLAVAVHLAGSKCGSVRLIVSILLT